MNDGPDEALVQHPCRRPSTGPLTWAGFTTVEQLAVLPDEVLIQVRNIGTKSLTVLRNAIAALRIVDCPAGVLLNGEHAQELATLLSILTTYADARGQCDVAARAQALLSAVLPQP